MSELEFLSPDRAAPEAVWRSPLEHPLGGAPASVRDLSRLGKLEVRGDLDGLEDGDGEVVRTAPERALVLCPSERVGDVRARLRDRFLVVDRTAALAGLEIEGSRLLSRLTELDLHALPTVGPLAGVQTVLLRDGEQFRLFFPQEYAAHVAAVVLDALEGLEAA